jgi:ribosomal protein L11 methyltransferase
VEADPEAVEAVSEILARVAPEGVSVEPRFELVDEGLGARVDPSRPATVRAYLQAGDPGAARASVEKVRRDLGHLQAFGLRPIGALETRLVHEEDWSTAWREAFPLLHVGRRLVIRPSWRRYRARATEVVLALDPGMAFGTGLHPTTRLCLAGIERWADSARLAGRSVLDLGSGSGILSIAAARLGASSVLALDTDPLAIESTRANARRNRVDRVVRARQGTLPATKESFDLVVANLVASILVAMAARLYVATRPGSGARDSGGRLLCSGIIAEREAEVRRALLAAGFRISGRTSETDWVALEAERIDGP